MTYVQGSDGRKLKGRALLDTCATANFITETFVKRLGVPIIKHSATIGAIDNASTVSRGIAQIIIHSIYDEYSKSLTCLIVPTIADLIPAETFSRDSFRIPQNIRLADPEFHIPRGIDLLVGSGTTLSLFSVGQINLSNKHHDLYLQKTRLGWIVTGSPSALNSSKSPTCHLTSLERQLTKFWEIEEITTDKPMSEEDARCEAHFSETVSRDNNGRYVVRLPFRKDNVRLGDSRALALKRLLSLERRFNINESFKTGYVRAIEEYMALGYISRVENPGSDGYYMPHHAVVKETSTTTKIRIVFDASAKISEGISLNSLLITGPTIQDKLFMHLIRFRTYNYVLTADIEKMYCQVQLHENDRCYQRILWRVNKEIETFQFNTLAFGVASSPFLAIRAIHQLADDEHHIYPRAAAILKRHLYVDDLLTGADTIEQARMIKDEVIALLNRGGFVIRQFV
ncbi:uncharacterized protein LOC120358684 [Solenopsis invicta]|uniref:uncharacterized protein LOC120358684 n=1 Tax=Solenopsis invicta TaxID=13686 RepID=UPI00193CA232|nr:uncharacterized protein LOC120358684 [Solenopsis invicta]